jgi:hypothetical protein
VPESPPESPKETISLIVTPEGGFILRRIDGVGAVAEMQLSENALALLSRAVQQMIRRIRKQRVQKDATAQGIQFVSSVMPSRPHWVNENIHGDAVLFEMKNESGDEITFRITAEHARWLGERLVRHAEAQSRRVRPKPQ